MINFIGYRKIGLLVSAAVFVLAIAALLFLGLKPGIDFTGGSLLEISFTEEQPTVQEVREGLAELNLGLENTVIQPAENKHMIFRLRFISEDEHQLILAKLREKFESNIVNLDASVVDEAGVVDFEEAIKNAAENRMWEERLETIGPAISSQLRQRAVYAMVGVNIAIILFIAYAFRRVSKPVASWKYGLVAVAALIHDVTVTAGVFALLGRFYGVEVGIPFVVALLTVLGYSVNDTIVVFDRIRENLIRRSAETFAQTINNAVNETLARSINTTLTTMLVLAALFFFGGETIKYFSLALLIGVFLGAYSSIFVASPLLVVWERWKHRQV